MQQNQKNSSFEQRRNSTSSVKKSSKAVSNDSFNGNTNKTEQGKDRSRKHLSGGFTGGGQRNENEQASNEDRPFAVPSSATTTVITPFSFEEPSTSPWLGSIGSSGSPRSRSSKPDQTTWRAVGSQPSPAIAPIRQRAASVIEPSELNNDNWSSLGMQWNNHSTGYLNPTTDWLNRRFSLGINDWQPARGPPGLEGGQPARVPQHKRTRSKSQSHAIGVENLPSLWEHPEEPFELMNHHQQQQQPGLWNHVSPALQRPSLPPAATGGTTAMPQMTGTPSLQKFTFDTQDDSFSEQVNSYRRHSLSETLMLNGLSERGQLADKIERMSMNEEEQQQDINMDAIDDYFSADSRLRVDSEHSSFDPTIHKGPIYNVEFKAGRSEHFFVPESNGTPSLKIKKGDLVIVEADRGKDLGKVTGEIPLRKFLEKSNAEGIKSSIKRICRLAESMDITQLQTKAQDENKAVLLCQQKVRQRKLPMEVVDAEYQWDRRKLTFYFIADRRIDFRELVRELFKIYKTRIWMCAQPKNLAPPSSPRGSINSPRQNRVN